MSRINGYTLYDGPSAYDGSRIIVVATGLQNARKSARDGAGTTSGDNDKTGAMVQTYIFRPDALPAETLRSGADVSNCGDCLHRRRVDWEETAKRYARILRGRKVRKSVLAYKRTCYVNIGQGPTIVFKSWVRGIYPTLSPFAFARMIASERLQVRLGTWGDPAAVVDSGIFWGMIVSGAKSHTGYTHATPKSAYSDAGIPLQGLVMASADSPQDRVDALAAGFLQTFRVVAFGDDTRMPGEARCPASAEAGRKVTCETCPLKCNGAAMGVVTGRVIQAHGPSRAFYA